MISVEDAVARVVAAFQPVESESVPLDEALDRVLAENLHARLDQPPFPVSAMDGYALRAGDAAAPGATLSIVGAAPAGHPFAGAVGAGQTVRIFTGGVVPDGADAVIVQEDAEADGTRVTFKVAAQPGRHIRKAGLDFTRGTLLAEAGRRVGARTLSLIASGDIAELAVRRRPRVAVAATGDELSRPGTDRKPGGIVASSVYGLSAMIARWGGAAVDLGIFPDSADAVGSIAAHAAGADLVLTIGGASVGDHDLVLSALGPKGFALDFWKIAMRPGKPLIFGRLGATPLLGLPGNPVSSLVCALLFVKPALKAMLGERSQEAPFSARLAQDLPANDSRQDYLRARLAWRDGDWWAEPFSVQDSSMQSIFAAADGLVVRPPYSASAKTGDRVAILRLDDI